MTRGELDEGGGPSSCRSGADERGTMARVPVGLATEGALESGTGLTERRGYVGDWCGDRSIRFDMAEAMYNKSKS
jgi:hypothetical protein